VKEEVYSRDEVTHVGMSDLEYWLHGWIFVHNWLRGYLFSLHRKGFSTATVEFEV